MNDEILEKNLIELAISIICSDFKTEDEKLLSVMVCCAYFAALTVRIFDRNIKDILDVIKNALDENMEYIENRTLN